MGLCVHHLFLGVWSWWWLVFHHLLGVFVISACEGENLHSLSCLTTIIEHDWSIFCKTLLQVQRVLVDWIIITPMHFSNISACNRWLFNKFPTTSDLFQEIGSKTLGYYWCKLKSERNEHEEQVCLVNTEAYYSFQQQLVHFILLVNQAALLCWHLVE